MGYRSGGYRSHDDPTIIFVIIGVLIVGVIGVWIYHYFRKKKIREYCERNRLIYSDSPVAMSGYSEAFDILNQGDSNYFSAGMHGKRGDIELNIVDFTVVKVYYTSKGRRTSKTNYTL